MITQPEQIQKASVTLNLMRQEMDVLRESKSTVSAEIRAAIKEKRDVIDELPSIRAAIKEGKKELKSIQVQLTAKSELLNEEVNKLGEVKVEHDRLLKEANEAKGRYIDIEKARLQAEADSMVDQMTEINDDKGIDLTIEDIPVKFTVEIEAK